MNAAITDYREVPAWIFMWLIALAIFAGCKWLTWRRACRSGIKPTLTRTLGYLLAWPGMDAPGFLSNDESGRGQPHSRTLAHTPERHCCREVLECSYALPLFPNVRQQAVRARTYTNLAPDLGSYKLWASASLKTLCGAWLIGFAARTAMGRSPMLAGWLGMIGLVMFLHFGLFHLLALRWQRAGVNAEPLMRAPLRATSLADFWSERWNTAFNKLAHDLAFLPMARRTGVKAATVGVFLISGLVHEMVISVPARGGFGLPTAYFLLQALGVLAERSAWGRGAGLCRGWRGWLWTVAFTAGPAFWLFHPPFVHHVILPMLRLIGAT